MKKLLTLTLALVVAFACMPVLALAQLQETSTKTSPSQINQTFRERVKEDYNLVWHDEFNGDTLDTTKWDFDGQIIHRNGELQVYADSMEDGNLEFDGECAIIVPKIETRVQADGSEYKYTSADITTEHKQTWKYGYFEVRAKPSCGKNLVPAVWMLGYDFENYKKDKRENCNWPRSGEIDILERQSDNAVYSTLHHTKYGTNKSGHIATGAGTQTFDHKLNEEFHDYWLYWTDKYIIVGVDDSMHQIIDITEPNLAQSFRSYEHWLIINVALGMFSKPVNDAEVDEWKMWIDYVRVYQLDDDKLYDNYLPFSTLDLMNNGNEYAYGKTVSTLKTESDLKFTMQDELEPGKYDVYAEINNVNTTASINGVETNKITTVDKGVSVGGQAYVGAVDLQDNSSFDISFSDSVKVKKLIFIRTDDTKTTPVIVNKDNSVTVSDYFEVSSEEELLNAAKYLSENGTIKLLNDITLTKNVQLFDGQIIDINGKTLTVNNGRIFINGEKEAITVKNGKVLISNGNRFIFTKENNSKAKTNFVDVDVTIDFNKSGSLFAHNYGNIFVTCSNCTFTYTDRTSTKDVYRIASDNVTFNNCIFNLNNISPVLAKKDRNIIFNNCTVNNASYLFNSDSALTSCNVTIANSTFNNLGALTNFDENAQLVTIAEGNTLKDENGNSVVPYATMSGNFTMTCSHYYVSSDCTTPEHCEYCNLIVGEATGHKPVTTTVPTSCFEKGSISTTCETCGIVLNETKIPVLEHNYVKIKTVAPTCLNAGYHLWGCTECSMTQLRSYYGDGVNTKVPHAFDKSQTLVIPPTCKLGGCTLEYCTSCNDTIKTVYKLSVDHDYTETVKKDEGVVLYECKYCDESYTAELEICAHEPLDDASVVIPPTCVEQGYTEHTCANCGEVYQTDVTQATGNHTSVVDKGYDATCTEAGLSDGSHCDVCKTVLVAQQSIKATGHTEKVTQKGIAPTCTLPGIADEIYCAVCNVKLQERTFIPAKGHEYKVLVTKEPTCGKAGVKTFKCECGHSYTESIPKTNAHKYVWKVTKKATYFANGTKSYKCSCGKVAKTATIKKLVLKKPTVKYTAGKKQIAVKYTKVTGATGFQVRYRLTTTKKWKTVYFKTAKSATKYIKSLTKNKKYYLQTRAYVQSGSKKAYSSWTTTKTIKVK